MPAIRLTEPPWRTHRGQGVLRVRGAIKPPPGHEARDAVSPSPRRPEFQPSPRGSDPVAQPSKCDAPDYDDASDPDWQYVPDYLRALDGKIVSLRNEGTGEIGEYMLVVFPERLAPKPETESKGN